MVVMSNLKKFKHEWIWEKPQATGFFNAKKMPMKAHENMIDTSMDFTGVKPEENILFAPNVFKENGDKLIVNSINNGGHILSLPSNVPQFISFIFNISLLSK
jgi:hypothetical protein